MSKGHTPPSFQEPEYHCPHCGVYSKQSFGQMRSPNGGKITTHYVSQCLNCNDCCFWIKKEMVYPDHVPAPEPAANMPDNVEKYYEEARLVVNDSPRAAAAVLRLAVEVLVDELNAEGDTLYQQIGYLVKKRGVPETVQQALDSVRVIGNESVHPGVLDMDDDLETALAIFDMVNIVVEATFGQQAAVSSMYQKIPESKREGIENRDN